MLTLLSPSEYQIKKRELMYRCNSLGQAVPTREFSGIISLATLIDKLGIVRSTDPDWMTRINVVGRPLIALLAVHKLGPAPVERS